MESGLSEQNATRRLDVFGPNQLRQTRPASSGRILWDQFASSIVALLFTAAVVAFAVGDRVEALAILAVILINATIGFTTEQRAVRSVEALRRLGLKTARVRRDGIVRELPAETLVPGDIVILDAGDVLSADIRLVEASLLQVDESPLTGESMPVDKDIASVANDAALSDRTCILFKGTALARGSGEGVVVATGMETELGRISLLIENASPDSTPLERRLDRLAHRLIGLTLAIAVLIAWFVVLSGRGLPIAIEIAVALAVATIPEGLPIVATVALARGMWRMARRNAVVERLTAVETLGSTTVILTDKTGTLTENRMTVVELRLAEGAVTVEGSGLEPIGEFHSEGQRVRADSSPGLLSALRIAVLCNNAHLERESDGPVRGVGDPTEVALLVAGEKAGLRRSELLSAYAELREYAFDPELKRMATLHQHEEHILAAVKGAPETIIPICRFLSAQNEREELGPEGHTDWLEKAERMASSGQRVLALAAAQVASEDDFEFQDLELVGLVGFFDPPRARVRDAIESCHRAGIRVVMVTGDHGATARTVAEAVGLVPARTTEGPGYIDARSLPPLDSLAADDRAALLQERVIARATPRQKLELIDLHQRNGQIVAMTGDGVNDAPALEKADIGVAMGMRGTQVAREAADMVLRDDEFGTIVAAVAEGRAIFANIRKFVVYLMSCNVSEILTVALGVLSQGPLPILPLQILFLNLVTDVFPALALGVGEGSTALMTDAPRKPQQSILSGRDWQSIFAYGGIMALSVIAALEIAILGLEASGERATTIAFLTLAMAQLWHVFSMRHPASPWRKNEITGNPWIWGALGLCLLILVGAVYLAPLAGILSLVDPGLSGWALALSMSLVPAVVGQIALFVQSRTDRSEDAPRPLPRAGNVDEQGRPA